MRLLQFTLAAASLGVIGGAAAYAQAPPQGGSFVKVCELYGSANQGAQAWHKDERCNLPAKFPLDTRYHQTNFNGAGGGASTNITASDIPGGIHLQVDGGHYWSVVQPMGIRTLDEDDEGHAISRQFFIHTYCGPAGFPGPGCNVKVTVWAKRRQR